MWARPELAAGERELSRRDDVGAEAAASADDAAGRGGESGGQADMTDRRTVTDRRTDMETQTTADGLSSSRWPADAPQITKLS